MRRAEHVEAHAFEVGLGRHQLIHGADTEGDMLHPLRRVPVTVHVRLGGQFKKGEHIAVPGIQEDMHVRIMRARRRHLVLGNGQLEIHAQRIAIELHRLLRILAAIGNMVNAFQGSGSRHYASSSTLSAPRSIWSRSMLSNKALKLPSPKPSL